MRPIKAREQLIIPDNGTNFLPCARWFDVPVFRPLVKVSVSSRVVQVTGKRGKLVRNFRHCRVDISMPKKNLIVVEKWFGTNKENAIVRTICSHINNMVKGVTTVSRSQPGDMPEPYPPILPRASATRCVLSTLTFPSTPW